MGIASVEACCLTGEAGIETCSVERTFGMSRGNRVVVTAYALIDGT